MKPFVVTLLVCLSFTLLAHAQTQSFWTTSTLPANATGNDNSSVELGLRFLSNAAGNVSGARVYCALNSSGTHTVHLWNSKGSSLGTATLPACTGWTAVNFASPIAITAGSTYTISYHTTEYPWNTGYFTSAVTSGNLTAPANAGVYRYGSSPAYPSSTWQSANYWVDVLFTPAASTPTYTISGTISGVGGATVNLSGPSSGSTTAGADGTYSFSQLANGTYTVTPTLSGYTFTPPGQMVTISNANGTANFTAAVAPPSISSLSPNSGQVGTSVTISGANFGAVQGGSTVSFSGIAAAVTSWSASTIVAKVPVAASTGNVFVTVGGVASNGLPFTVTSLSLPSHAQVLAAITTVNNYWISHHSRPGDSNWARATYFTGNLAAYDATGQSNYLSYAQSWASKNHYSLYSGNTTTYADYQAAGQVYIRLYQLNPVASDIAGITQSLTGMINSTQADEWTWIDAINMSMPDFAELGVLYNDTSYYDKMYTLYTYPKYALGLYDPATDLWWRDSTFANGSIYWSRGNGWVFAAHAKVLSVLPTSDPHYDEYLQTFIAMAKALAARQQPGGYWNSDLNGTDYAGPESSGTSFFLYGLAWGVNNNILTRDEYLPVIENAWNFLANTAIQPSGLLGYVQPSAAGPGATSATTTEDFGVGAFLLAGREMALLTN
jgi:rhamnogalacturonyl hydrolase YesR